MKQYFNKFKSFINSKYDFNSKDMKSYDWVMVGGSATLVLSWISPWAVLAGFFFCAHMTFKK